MGQSVLREWVVGGGGLDGYFGEQGLPVGTQECLERFHRGCVYYLSRHFVPEWDSPNGEGELATARAASLLVELRTGCFVRDTWRMIQNVTVSYKICYKATTRVVINSLFT